MLNISVVENKKTKNDFLYVVKHIYKEDPNYIAHIYTDIEAVFNPKTNDFFLDGECQRFVIYQNNKCIGRIAAFYNTDVKNSIHGGCGFFECTNNAEAAHLLFTAAQNWLKLKGISKFLGPVNFGARDAYWGLLIQSFSYPSYRENYNPPYYLSFFTNFGFKLNIEQSTYEITVDTFDYVRFSTMANRIFANPNFSFAYLDYKKVNLFADYFTEIYNKAWEFHADFKPMNKEKMKQNLKKFKTVLPAKTAIFAFANNKPAGFYISILEINQVFKFFKGKLDLLNKIWFLSKKSKINKIRGIIFGLIPEVQGTGIDVGMIMYLYNAMKDNPTWQTAELSWIGDFNPKMFGLLDKLGAKRTKIHHTFEKIID